MPKWEYLNVTLAVFLTAAELDDLGSKGWELVAVVSGKNAVSYFFKRPSYDEEPGEPGPSGTSLTFGGG